MDFTISIISFSCVFSPNLVALAATISCILFTIFLISRRSKLPSSPSELERVIPCGVDERSEIDSGEKMTTHVNGGSVVGSENGGGDMMMAVEKQTGASMMEQLVPEITMHALSYLDYPSLCRLSMTNSLMRKVANDDNAWKALYHKDFTLEQDSLVPPNGWKVYYATTRAILNVNNEFFRIVRERSLPAMSQFWLNADYVKCFHATLPAFSGYNAVVESWQLGFRWNNIAAYQVIGDVRTRVVSDMAWITMKAYVDVDRTPDNVTNVYEFVNGRWYLVHHHCSTIVAGGVFDP